MNASIQETAEPGQALKAKRESLGMSVDEIAKKLRLKVQVILDLEDNAWAKFESAVYVTGYLRGYANVLGLDGNRIIGMLHASGAFREEPRFDQFSFPPGKTLHQGSLVAGVTWLIVIALLILFSFWYQAHYRDPLPVGSEPHETDANAPQTEPTPIQATDPNSAWREDPDPGAMVDPNENADAPPSAEFQATEGLPTGNSEMDSEDDGQSALTGTPEAANQATRLNPPSLAEPTQEPLTPLPPAEGDDNPELVELRLKATGESWVEIEDAQQTRLFMDLAIAGREEYLMGIPPFLIVIGNPDVVELYLDGERRELEPNPSSGVARQLLE